MRIPLLLTVLAISCLPLAVKGQKATAQPSKFENIQVEGVKWSSFHDPNEHAFSVDVPEGWKAEGGLVRRNSIDTSTFLRVLSPDGTVMLMMGDPAPAFFRTPGFARRPTDKVYEGGKAFARSYGESSLPSVCSDLKFTNGAERTDIENGPLAKAVPGSHYDAGEAFFSCTHNGKPTRAYVVAGTYIYQSRMTDAPSFWGVNLLDACIAPADRLDWSRKILLHMLLSARNDPDWVRAQQARVDQATRNLNAITAAQQGAFERNLANAQAQQRAMTHQYNAFSEVQTQTGTFVDNGGHRYVLPNTQSYHWVGPGGKTTETSSPTPPAGGGWTQLKQVPPQ